MRELLDNGTGTNKSAENSDRDYLNGESGAKRVRRKLEKSIMKISARPRFFLVR